MDKAQTGMAGEFHVLAQLTQRGLVASLTLGNTKGVDILVSNPEFDRLLRVEVKTTDAPPRAETLFGVEKSFSWPMSEKHEHISDPRLFYCLVHLEGIGQMPRFFIVPSEYVAVYVREQHLHWERSRNYEVAKTAMRKFRIAVSDPLGFENNWKVFETGEAEARHRSVNESWLPVSDALPAS